MAEDIYADMLRRGRVKPDVQLLNSLINVFVKVSSLHKMIKQSDVLIP